VFNRCSRALLALAVLSSASVLLAPTRPKHKHIAAQQPSSSLVPAAPNGEPGPSDGRRGGSAAQGLGIFSGIFLQRTGDGNSAEARRNSDPSKEEKFLSRLRGGGEAARGNPADDDDDAASEDRKGFCEWLCGLKAPCPPSCLQSDPRVGISQHLPMGPSPKRKFFRFPRRKQSGSRYMQRLAEKAIPKYSQQLEAMYHQFKRDIHKKRERSWELTVRQSSPSLAFESYRRVCPKDVGSIEYDQRTMYVNATVKDLEEFYRDDTHRAVKDGSTESLEILATDKASHSIVLYQLVRYPWPLINREYVYVRRRFQDGDKFYYVMKAVNGKEVLPNEQPDDSFRPRRLCTSMCVSGGSKQRVEDFECMICFAPSKENGQSGVEWRQVGRESFGIRNAMVTRAAKMAAAKSLWPFQKRLEESFRCYKDRRSFRDGRGVRIINPLRPVVRLVGWTLGTLLSPLGGGSRKRNMDDSSLNDADGNSASRKSGR